MTKFYALIMSVKIILIELTLYSKYILTKMGNPHQEIAHFTIMRFFLAAQSLASFDVTLMYDVVFYGFRELRNIPF